MNRGEGKFTMRQNMSYYFKKEKLDRKAELICLNKEKKERFIIALVFIGDQI